VRTEYTSREERYAQVRHRTRSARRKLGPHIQWVHSYVTGEKIYCVYIAPNEEIIREHAAQGGFPCNRISEVKAVIDPATAPVDALEG
jgi:hypothetical protein